MTGVASTRYRPPVPHDYDEDPQTPDRCRCRLPREHQCHSPEAIEAERRRADGWKAEEARRTGERT